MISPDQAGMSLSRKKRMTCKQIEKYMIITTILLLQQV